MFTRTYSLRKSRKILHWAFKRWEKKRSNSSNDKALENTLKQLEDAIFEKDREKASRFARHAEIQIKEHYKKSWFESGIEFTVAIVFALIVATIVRQMWFELYEIPTGSMRPTFREQDRLTVTKTAFGLNVPLNNTHFYFDPDLVERGKVVIFSAEGLPISDVDTTYFGIFPYKKRYIKRLIGKPGDSLYFYGGEVYGVDKEGKPIKELIEDPWMKKIEHIPFLRFEGELTNTGMDQFMFQHLHMPMGKMSVSRSGTKAEVFDGSNWVKETPFEKKEESGIHSFGDLYGIKNFAMARLLTKEELKKYADIEPDEDALLYLQLKHNPNLLYPNPKLQKNGGYYTFQMPAFESIIPLNQKHLDALMENMYTARFVVQNGKVGRYHYEKGTSATVPFAGVPDGTYEFYHGKAEKVGFKGNPSLLDPAHPLYKRDPKHVQHLFNYGMEGTVYDPETFYKLIWPYRYAYYRNGDLYLMGAPILKKDDSVLTQFIEKEKEKEKNSTKSKPYLPFIDHGAPSEEMIKTQGLKVPEKSYLVLGDNHAMSADSRVFGFVPERNLEGAPSFILWPFGERWGFPPQVPYPFMNIPRMIVWAIAAIIFAIWYYYHRKKMNTRLPLN